MNEEMQKQQIKLAINQIKSDAFDEIITKGKTIEQWKQEATAYKNLVEQACSILECGPEKLIEAIKGNNDAEQFEPIQD